jgi:O-methyltransferase
MDSETKGEAAPRKDTRPRDPEQWVRRPIEKYRRPKHAFQFRPDAAFFELADAVVKPERTLLGYDRLYVLWQSLRNTVGVPGIVAEVGSYRGGSAHFIASALLELSDEEVPIHIFDTFDGHPEGTITEHDTFQTVGKFRRTSYEAVCEYLAPFEQVRIHKGDIVTLLPSLSDSAYRLVHIDTDLYQPPLACLDYFGARLLRKGVIVVDDYGSPKCTGVPAAVAEHLQRTDGYQVWDMRSDQLMLVKS